jgi:hypothetical protein
MKLLKSLGRRFVGTALLFSGLVGLGTSLILFLSSSVGYLPYSDRRCGTMWDRDDVGTMWDRRDDVGQTKQPPDEQTEFPLMSVTPRLEPIQAKASNFAAASLALGEIPSVPKKS